MGVGVGNEVGGGGGGGGGRGGWRRIEGRSVKRRRTKGGGKERGVYIYI